MNPHCSAAAFGVYLGSPFPTFCCESPCDHGNYIDHSKGNDTGTNFTGPLNLTPLHKQRTDCGEGASFGVDGVAADSKHIEVQTTAMAATARCLEVPKLSILPGRKGYSLLSLGQQLSQGKVHPADARIAANCSVSKINH